jgi:hypothetical protein
VPGVASYTINAKWTFAIDVETGRQIWRTPVQYEPGSTRAASTIYRGAPVIYNGKLLRVTADHVYAQRPAICDGRLGPGRRPCAPRRRQRGADQGLAVDVRDHARVARPSFAGIALFATINVGQRLSGSNIARMAKKVPAFLRAEIRKEALRIRGGKGQAVGIAGTVALRGESGAAALPAVSRVANAQTISARTHRGENDNSSAISSTSNPNDKSHSA